MKKDLRANHSLINLSSANSTNTSFCGRQKDHQLIVRRQVPAQPINDRRKKSGLDSQALAVRYIPLTKMATQENSISLPISRQNSKENLHNEPNDLATRRFQRHSERIYLQNILPKSDPEPEVCVAEACLE
jgi:hypothetical protein